MEHKFIEFLMLFITDVLLGYVPQAAGCATCLFTLTNQKLFTKQYWGTTGLFSAVAIIIRTAFNIGLIDFGFHTVVIWSIFILIAIFHNKFSATQSILSILISGILIAFTEIITAVVMIIIYGNDKFNAMMNNTQTIDGKIMKAASGIPANLLFLLVVLVIYMIASTIRKRKNKAEPAKNPANP